jgi:ribosome recycling factor
MDEGKISSRMQQVIDLVTSDVASIRTGRANASLVENIEVPAYGGTQKLMVKELGTISVIDARTITIDPWDKSIIGEVRKGILNANVGLNPNIDGEIIRISLPPMTSQDREKYIKLLSTKLENGKVMVRQIRQEFMQAIRDNFENKELSEDERFNQEKRLQEMTDDFIGRIEAIGEKKEKELAAI